MSDSPGFDPATLRTEQRHEGTVDIDLLSPLDVLRRLNEQDASVAGAVEKALPALARLVETTVRCLEAAGRVHYFGAGTSGRMAALDAAELPPTFGTSPDLFVAHMAGGPQALHQPVESAEDSTAAGYYDARAVTGSDIVIGVSASGRTPYVRGALLRGLEVEAHTALITNNPLAALAELATDVVIADTGPEVLAGSTRLKAGTAAKLLLNGFSTAVMIARGHTYSNLMVDVRPTNDKLRARVVLMIGQATGCPPAKCRAALAEADGNVRAALVMLLTNQGAQNSTRLLSAAGGTVRAATAMAAQSGGASGVSG